MKGIVGDFLAARDEESRLYNMIVDITTEIFDHQIHGAEIMREKGFATLYLLPNGTDINIYRKITPERLERVWALGADRLHVITEVVRKFYRGGPVEGEHD